MSRDDRQRQLLDVAWQVVGKEGTDALTLGRVAGRAGVTKPVVYDHFGTRAGLLAALYREFDERQTALMDAALDTSAPTLAARADVIASSYVDCVIRQGREIPGIIAALASSRELEEVKREHEAAFMEKCRRALAPFTKAGTIAPAGLRAMLGAAEALSYAATTGEITAAQAQRELVDTIVDMVARSARAGTDRAGKARRSKFALVESIGRTLPDVEVTTTYGQPALKVRGRMFVCIASNKAAEPDTLVVMMDIADRDILIEEAPDVYYLKTHYVNYPCVLVRLSRVDPDALRDLVTSAHRYVSAKSKRRSARARRPAGPHTGEETT